MLASCSWLISILFATAVALTSFGAVYRPAALGFLAASPGILLIATILFPLALVQLLEKKPLSKPSLNAWRLLGYGVLASVFSFIIFGWSDKYLAKSAALLILSAVWLFPLLSMDYLRLQHLRIGLICALCICIIGYLLSDLVPGSMPAAVRQVVFSIDYQVIDDGRPRGFMMEPSVFGTQIGRFALLLFLIFEAGRNYTARRLFGFIVCLMVVMVVVGSKGAAISALLSLFFIGFAWRQLAYFILLIPVFWWGAITQINAVAADIESFSSTSTRLILWLTSVTGLIINPFGYGYYGFYGAVQGFGRWAMTLLDKNLPVISLTEATDIIENLNNVSSKSTPLDFTLVFGVFFVWMMVSLCKRIELRDPRAKVACVYLLLTSLSTSGHESVSFFLGFVVLIKAFPRKPFRSHNTN